MQESDFKRENIERPEEALDLAFERELASRFAVLATPGLDDCIADSVVASIEQRQRLIRWRPWLILVAGILGLLLSLPSFIAVLDGNLIANALGSISSILTELALPTDFTPVLGQFDLSGKLATLNPTMTVIALLLLLGGVAVASEA